MIDDAKRVKAEYRSSIRSKVLIKNALLSLMREKSFDKISVTDIVDRADINRGTFYAHFKDVRGVLDKICAGMVDEILFSIKETDVEDIVKDNSIVFKKISDYISKDLEYFKLILKIDGIHDFILRKKSDAIRVLLESDEISKSLVDMKEAEVVIDFAISAIVDTYSDIVLERLSVTLDEAPQYLSKIINTVLRYYPRETR